MSHDGVCCDSIEQNTLLIDIATRNVIRLAPRDSVGEAARIMAEMRISSIVVTDEQGHPAGIVTERNMLHAMQSGYSPDVALQEVMSSPVITVPESMTCLAAYQVCLRDGIRHLVIVDDQKRLLGVVSETDFRRRVDLSTLAGRRQVSSVMSPSVFSLPPDAPLQEALNLMQMQRDTCVVVVDGERPLGIVTERDIVRLYSANPGQAGVPLSQIMTSPVLTVTREHTVMDAAEMMLKFSVRHLVVVNQTGDMAGLISEHGLTQAMTIGMIDSKINADGAFLRTLIGNIPDMIWVKDVNGVYLACNARFERMFGAKEKDILGKTDFDFVPGDLAESFRMHDRLAMEKNAPSVNEEWVVFADDGHRELLETIKTPMRDMYGNLIGVLGIARDITERKAMQRQVAEQLAFTRTVIDTEIDALAVCHDIPEPPYMRFTVWNPSMEVLTGYSMEEINRLGWHRVVSAEAWQAVRRRMTGVRRGDHLRGEEWTITRKDGERKVVHIYTRALTEDEHGMHVLTMLHDVTERKRVDALLSRQQRFSDDVINSLPGIFYMLDRQGGFVRMNPQFSAVTGYSDAELGRMSALALFDGKSREIIAQKMQEVFETGSSWAEADLITKSGQRIPYYFSGHRTYFDDQPYLVGLGTDITERKLAEENLRITASVFDNSQEAILITDANNVITDVNPAFTLITGYSREEVLGKHPGLLSSGLHDPAFYAGMWKSLREEKSWRGEIWNRRKTGEIYAELLSIAVILDCDGNVQRHVGVSSDISYLKEHEAALSRIAHYDALTGIPNRMLLADRMRQAIAQTSREHNMVAVCYLDLDGFKPVNDTFGHDAGDQVLIEIAKRLGDTVRGGDTVARLGGDEFVVLLLGLERGDECMKTLERLLGAIAEPVLVKGSSLTLGASIGVSIYPLDDADPDTLLRHADQAMYVAKQSGKNRFYIYDAALDQRTRDLNEFFGSIRHGLASGQFELYYQPKVNLRTRQLAGVEALIRWRHPERGLLVPAEFLRHIENTELDIEIGDWVIATALEQIKRWHDAGRDFEVSVNISAYHLEAPRFAEKLCERLGRYPDLPAGRLQIEVLETAALNDIAIVREVIDACRRLGVTFALDDFGTGYSSLSYLSNLPVDVLKIDQSFVRDMLDDKGYRAIVQGIIALARAFDRKTVAEGIETAQQYQALLELDCEFGQGYGIARPMRAEELTAWQAGF